MMHWFEYGSMGWPLMYVFWIFGVALVGFVFGLAFWLAKRLVDSLSSKR